MARVGACITTRRDLQCASLAVLRLDNRVSGRHAPRSPARRPAWRQVATGNVVALGPVSLITDISSEMVTAVLPVYLVLGLHLSLAAYGVLDGVYTGATALLRLLGGYVADRFRRRKLVAGLGYGLSAVAKLGAAGRRRRRRRSVRSSRSTAPARACAPRRATR